MPLERVVVCHTPEHLAVRPLADGPVAMYALAKDGIGHATAYQGAGSRGYPSLLDVSTRLPTLRLIAVCRGRCRRRRW